MGTEGAVYQLFESLQHVIKCVISLNFRVIVYY